MQQAQAAIVLVVLRCLGGTVLFRSSCPSPNSSYPFWLLALTFRSSRPAFGGRLTSPVSTIGTPMIDAVLVKWEGQPEWHIAPSEIHATTACERKIPLSTEPVNHQEIDLLQIDNFQGMCKKCFHELCIEHQVEPLWNIYYKYIVGEK